MALRELLAINYGNISDISILNQVSTWIRLESRYYISLDTQVIGQEMPHSTYKNMINHVLIE